MKLPKRISPPSSPKTPKLLQDLYADLRDRRLLPLVALLLVAIVAAPILLAGGGSQDPTPSRPPVASKSAQPAAATFSVVPTRQELRDYRKRLGHRKAKNPFDPYAASGRKTPTKEDFENAAATVEEAPETEEEASPEPVEEDGGSAAPAAPPAPPKVTVKANLEYTIDINAGYLDHTRPIDGVKVQEKLPKPEAPVVVFTGLSPDKKGALFLMSNSVSAFYGAGRCVLGGSFCQILELRPGEGASFAVGYGESRYKLHLRKIAPVLREATVSLPRGG